MACDSFAAELLHDRVFWTILETEEQESTTIFTRRILNRISFNMPTRILNDNVANLYRYGPHSAEPVAAYRKMHLSKVKVGPDVRVYGSQTKILSSFFVRWGWGLGWRGG